MHMQTLDYGTGFDSKLKLILRGYIFQKLLLACKFSCINKNCFFVKETDTFDHIVV